MLTLECSLETFQCSLATHFIKGSLLWVPWDVFLGLGMWLSGRVLPGMREALDSIYPEPPKKLLPYEQNKAKAKEF